jgi:hypothetical protein
MRKKDSNKELQANSVGSKDVLAICRNHIESLQNLRYMASQEIDYPTQVKLHLRMIEWHLFNLSEALFPASIPGTKLNISACNAMVELSGMH